MRELHVDWAALHSAFQMPMPEVRCFLSLVDGRVLKVAPGDPTLATVNADRNEYVPVETVPSRIQYQWVDEFAKTVEDDALRARVEAAINGKGAFRRFKDIMLTTQDERRRWFEFRDEKMRQRIVEWVCEKGIEALNEPPWESGEEFEKPYTTAFKTHTRDVEALRDLLIDWFDGKDETAQEPLALEELATEISERFFLRPV